MVASIIDGKSVALKIQSDLKKSILTYNQQWHRSPGLAVILLGDDPASQIYVRNKRKACEHLGVKSFAYDLTSQTTEQELLMLIDKLNLSSEVDGILVQLPLPDHINTQKVIEHINPDKDVDGFHPYNFGRLAQGNPNLRPCTPFGIIKLLEHYNIPLHGMESVVIGASNIVGRPMALELLLSKATVSICHSATDDLEHYVRNTQLIVIATGKQDVVKPNWLNHKQIIIDVGMHRLPNNMLRGDIDFHIAKEKVAWITPVPGGVGPMTICMLLHNTLTAAQHLVKR